jgi:rubredoxin
MYRCERCHTVVPPHTPATLIVVETRPRHYPIPDKPPKRRGKSPDNWKPHPGDGWEIAKELRVCPSCAAAYRQQHSQASDST